MNTMERSTGGLSKDMTTFVQADLDCFREVVQRLTGTSESECSDANLKSAATTTKTSKAQKQQPISKLHRRRQCQRLDIEITNSQFQFQPIVIPSPYEWQPIPRNQLSLSLSPFSLQPLSPHELSSPPPTRPNKRASPSIEMINKVEEEKAIKERRFYLHPSPRALFHFQS
ncbi:hypothetical protein HAX54_021140 [Datura stramonium]|uniref:VQ domain-containing protein n=1 Tax=Datura stramonium TaxID=4076 RepID=A0ABS8UUL2_DATST|nr:hypothetical protein [Datura stramonium]